MIFEWPMPLLLSPGAARDLVMAVPKTTKESEAIAFLRPALADCVPPKVQMRFTPRRLQGMLAEALYDSSLTLSQVSNKDATQ